ncbi:DUF4192 domain-containing protein [Salinifilum ghardaiensis]
MTTTPLNISVSVSRPEELLAALPHLVGFTPADSLVVLTLRGEEGDSSLGSALRMDLPCATRHAEAVRYLLDGPLAAQRVDALFAIVIGARRPHRCRAHCPPGCAAAAEVNEHRSAEAVRDEHAELPHAELVDHLEQAARQAGMGFVHALWAPEISTGAPWRCFRENDCHGQLPDVRSSSVAAAMTAAGVVAFRDRDELTELVAPESTATRQWRSDRLDTMLSEREGAGERPVRDEIRTVFGAIERTGQGGALTEDDLLRVLLAVSQTQVRDLVLGTALGPKAAAAEQLWLTLVRKAPDPEVADVAALLAFSAYLRGDGALASVALERIEHCRPEHTLGLLLRRAVNAGLPPDKLRRIAEDAATDAQIGLDEDGAE